MLLLCTSLAPGSHLARSIVSERGPSEVRVWCMEEIKITTEMKKTIIKLISDPLERKAKGINRYGLIRNLKGVTNILLNHNIEFRVVCFEHNKGIEQILIFDCTPKQKQEIIDLLIGVGLNDVYISEIL